MGNEMRDASAVGARIEKLLTDIADFGDARASRTAEQLVRTLLEFYGTGLARIMEFANDSADPKLVARLAGDGLVGGLLVLHDLHPDSTLDRVSGALEKVRPYLGSHAGDVDLTGIDENGVVHLALKGSCDGCPSSTVTVKLAIEQAITAAAPEINGIDVAGVVPEQTGPGGRRLLPLVTSDEPATPDWVEVADLSEVRPGQILAVDVGEFAAIICALPNDLYAYADRCAVCSASLAAAELTEEESLRCPACSAVYDVKGAGRELAGSAHLDPLPLLHEDGRIRVAGPVVVPS
jgi:Fe-S cluster biogenesis protein NfuA/nitrite reductase/ring-hydroxylating ferredoxin subunit